MAQFHSRSFPPLGVNRDPLPPKSKLPVNLRDSLFDLFMEELRHPKSPMNMLMITLPGFDPFPVRLERVGKTSLITRRLIGLDTAAISLSLSGGADDETALNQVATELIGDQEEVRPAVEALVAVIRKEPKPMSAAVHFDESTYDDQATRVTLLAASGAFFDFVAESQS